MTSKNPAYYHQQIGQFFHNKYVMVTVENERSQRTLQQNRYWFGVCYPIIAEATGYTVMEVHEWAKEKFIEPKFVTIAGEETEIRKSTTELSKNEGVEYTMALREFSNDKLNAYIPTPCEAGYFYGRKDCAVCNPQD